jgi:hypothetical protein
MHAYTLMHASKLKRLNMCMDVREAGKPTEHVCDV